METHVEWRAGNTFVAQGCLNPKRGKQILRVLQAAPRQCQVFRSVLRAMDDARLAEGGQPHCLRPVEFWILEGSQSHQAVAQPRREILFSNVDLIAEHQFERLGQRPLDRWFLPPTRGRSGPGEIFVLILQSQPHAGDTPSPFGLTRQRLDLHPHELPHRGKKRPLVLMRLELLVQENAVARRPGLLLQRQRNQVAEAAFGQGILVGKQPVIRSQADFRAALHGLGEKI